MSLREALTSVTMGQPRRTHSTLLALLYALYLVSAHAQSDRFGSPEYPGGSGEPSAKTISKKFAVCNTRSKMP